MNSDLSKATVADEVLPYQKLQYLTYRTYPADILPDASSNLTYQKLQIQMRLNPIRLLEATIPDLLDATISKLSEVTDPDET